MALLRNTFPKLMTSNNYRLSSSVRLSVNQDKIVQQVMDLENQDPFFVYSTAKYVFDWRVADNRYTPSGVSLGGRLLSQYSRVTKVLHCIHPVITSCRSSSCQVRYKSRGEFLTASCQDPP